MKTILLAASLLFQVGPPPSLQDLARQARAAYDAKDYVTFMAKTEQAAKLAPADVWVLYNLACGQAQAGRRDDALKTLDTLAARKVRFDLDAEGDFASLRESAGYRKVSDRMKKLADDKVSSSTVAFRIPEKGLVPEGIAYDSKTRAFFVSSIRKRKIVRVTPDGKASDFVSSGRDGLRAVLGMRVDPAKRRLWACTAAMSHMEGFREGQPPESALLEFDADSGKLVRERALPIADPDPRSCDDVALGPDGSVYVNDTAHPVLFVLKPGATDLETFIDNFDLGQPQGFAVSDDGKTVYVSNYRRVMAIDVESRKLRAVETPVDFPPNGIDGLAFSKGALYAVQNGIEPHRVVKMTLSADGSRITAGRILEMNNPLFDEPTLGIVADGAFVYVADSQGGKFRKSPDKVPAADQREVVVLKIPLAGK
jgi:sugar lactone lactonase YvrE